MGETGGVLVSCFSFAAALDPADNRVLVDRALTGVEPGSADLVVLPEAAMADFGPADADLAAHAEPLDGPFVTLLAEHARRIGAVVLAGMFEATDALPFNTLVAVGPGGLIASYRKVHLYDSFGYRESDRLSPGDLRPTVIDVAGTRVGLMTCYDLRFPELARALVDHDARLIVVPAAWVAGEHKLDHWRTLLAARAIENTCWVLGVGQNGRRYTGHSGLYDPWGVRVAEDGPGTGDGPADGPEDGAVSRLDVRVDADLVDAVREVNPSLANRRWNTGGGAATR